MAITDTQKVDYLFKKVGFGATKTDINSVKGATNEAIPSPLLIRGDKILGDAETRKIASGVILSPKGTILHGNLSLDIEKRPKIKIYYTEPED